MGQKMDRDINSWRPWSELPRDLLDIISEQLSMMDHLAFSGVCRLWRASALACKKEIIASQPPFLVALSAHAEGTLSFIDMFEGRKYKTQLPNFADKFCSGFCCGYLVMEDRNVQNGLWLVNPFTRLELHFPAPPERIHHTVITSTVPSDSSIVALSADYENLLYCRPGYDNWIVLPVASKLWVYLDLAVFKKKIYALTSEGKVWQVNVNSNFPLTLVAFRGVPYLNHMGLGRNFGFLRPTLHLVASEEELLMVNLTPHEEAPQIFKLDFVSKQWLEIESLGDNALFLSDVTCGMVSNTYKWKGYSGGIYCTNLISNMCIAVDMEGEFIGSSVFAGNVVVGGFPSSSPYWYFRSQS